MSQYDDFLKSTHLSPFSTYTTKWYSPVRCFHPAGVPRPYTFTALGLKHLPWFLHQGLLTSGSQGQLSKFAQAKEFTGCPETRNAQC